MRQSHGPAVTISSLFDETSPHGSLTLLPTRIMHGVKVVGVHGKASDSSPAGTTATLWIAVDTNLPVSYIAGKADGAVLLPATFSKWGTPADLTAPTDLLVLRSPLPLDAA